MREGEALGEAVKGEVPSNFYIRYTYLRDMPGIPDWILNLTQARFNRSGKFEISEQQALNLDNPRDQEIT